MLLTNNDSERRAPILAGGALLAGFGALTIVLVLLSVTQPAVLVGVLILAAAAVQVMQAIRGPELWSRIWHGALGAIYLIAAIVLFFRPETQRTALWLAIAAFFLADGGLRLYLGYHRSKPSLALWLIASGVGSVAIALLIYFGLPSASATGWQLGLLIGLALFFGGGFLMWLARGPLPEEPAAPAATLPPPTAPETPIEDPV